LVEISLHIPHAVLPISRRGILPSDGVFLQSLPEGRVVLLEGFLPVERRICKEGL
jgi:hypothetical protein